jgi:hypothetical protein
MLHRLDIRCFDRKIGIFCKNKKKFCNVLTTFGEPNPNIGKVIILERSISNDQYFKGYDRENFGNILLLLN